MPYNNKFIKSLFISGVVFMILMALLSTTQMISGLNQQAETGSSGASAQNSQISTQEETKATPTAAPSNGPRITNNRQSPARIQRRAVQAVSPTNATITGDSAGLVLIPYTFIANVTGTNPMTYSWEATDLVPITTANSSALTDSQDFIWPSVGVKTITVTIDNSEGSTSATHQITITNAEIPPVTVIPLTGVTISGSTSGNTNTSYPFNASITPITATSPITYVWQASDQSTITTTTATQSFSWSSAGTKTITVTASNISGTETSTPHNITISSPPVSEIAPSSVNISGPSSGDPGTSYSFNANVDPSGTTLPVTIQWEVTDHDTVSEQSSSLSSNPRSFSWSTPGIKTIVVTVSNGAGSVSTTYQFTVNDTQVAPSSVSILGSTTGLISSTYEFVASVSPLSTTQPISYLWQATDQTGTTHSGGTLTDVLSLNWSSLGEKTITVIASNSHGSVSDTHQITILEEAVAPESVTISGMSSGFVNADEIFTATVSPISTTLPITYVWQATDQTGTTHSGGTLSDLLSLNWNSIGEKTITVVASNSQGSVSDTHQITILEEGFAPEGVTISGISNGLVDTNYTFNASVSPISTTEPITYVWEATGQAARTTNALTDSFSVSWDTPGEKTVKVVVSNEHGSVTAEHLVTIEDDAVAPQEVSISGAANGLLGTDYAFSANVGSISTTQPITYVWQATDQDDVTEVGGTLTGLQSFNWSTPGKKTITVIASNSSGTVTSNHSIMIQEDAVGPAEISMSGPRNGLINTDYTFTANVGPISTTEPITYVWQATDQSNVTQVGGRLTARQSFRWSTPGEKTITVIASNPGGSVTAFDVIKINVAPVGITIDGPESGYVDRTYSFMATVRPPESNQPITYTWESTDHEPLTLFDGTLSDTQELEWEEPGEKMITVTVQNDSGTVSNTHLITIEEAPPIAVVIEGLDEGDVETTYNFVATVRRSHTTVPLTYTWESSGQEAIVRSSDALVDIMPISWTIEGPQMITVTAANHLGAVSDTHEINIKRRLLGFVMSDSPDPVRISDTLSYFITVTNNALVTAEEAVLLDELPEDVTFIDAVASQGSCSEEDGDVTCQLGTLESGQEATITLTMQPNSSGRLINRANISSSTEELQVDARTIAEDTLVSKPGLGISNINPNASFNDVPSVVYLDGFGFSDVLSVTLTGTMTDTVTGTLETLLDIRYIDPVLIMVEIPAGLPGGLYDITVNTATEEAVVSKGYEIQDFELFNDLYALPEWFSTHPRPLRVGKEGSGISLTLQHLGGAETLENVAVEFRLDSVDGELLGSGNVASLPPSAKGSTEIVSWQPDTSQQYTVVAIIDPDNEIEESDELNNVITRTIFVLPQAEDTLPPIVEEFLIEDDAQTILDQNVTLDVTASDADKPGATGIEAIKFIEFEYILGARRWVPIQRSPWITYRLAQIDYPWKMIPTFGMRYMQAWSVDGQRNISLEAGTEVVSLLPTQQTGYVGRNGVVFYRFYLEEGETFAATLNPISGDPDLHVWGPTGQRWSSNNFSGVENVQFEAPTVGTYQIEVHGFSNANYNLTLGSTTSLRRNQAVAAKPLPEESAVPLNDWPEYHEIDPPEVIATPPVQGSTLYLPLMMR